MEWGTQAGPNETEARCAAPSARSFHAEEQNLSDWDAGDIRAKTSVIPPRTGAPEISSYQAS
jgi:hypothetical protein